MSDARTVLVPAGRVVRWFENFGTRHGATSAVVSASWVVPVIWEMTERAQIDRWMTAAADGDRAAIDPLFGALWPIVTRRVRE